MRGLYVPGAPALGNISSGSSGGGADLSDIDLTAATLDSRIKYQCASSHAYYAADGTIQFAEPDVWPLEYRDGVAVGRHEPEPQSTNYMNSSDPVNMRTAISGGTLNRKSVDATLGLPTVSAEFITPSASSSIYTMFGIHNGEPAPFQPGVTSVYISVDSSEPFVAYTNNVTAIRATQLDAGLQKYILRDDKPISYVMMGLRNVQASYTALMCGFQCEPGEHVTSPIISGHTATTRAAAFASVKNPGGIASSIRVHYSDSAIADFIFPADGADIQLPQSATDWGTRYITRIQFARSL